MDKNKMGFEWIQILRITFFWTWLAFTVIQSSNIVMTREKYPGLCKVKTAPDKIKRARIF